MRAEYRVKYRLHHSCSVCCHYWIVRRAVTGGAGVNVGGWGGGGKGESCVLWYGQDSACTGCLSISNTLTHTHTPPVTCTIKFIISLCRLPSWLASLILNNIILWCVFTIQAVPQDGKMRMVYLHTLTASYLRCWNEKFTWYCLEVDVSSTSTEISSGNRVESPVSTGWWSDNEKSIAS